MTKKACCSKEIGGKGWGLIGSDCTPCSTFNSSDLLTPDFLTPDHPNGETTEHSVSCLLQRILPVSLYCSVLDETGISIVCTDCTPNCYNCFPIIFYMQLYQIPDCSNIIPVFQLGQTTLEHLTASNTYSRDVARTIYLKLTAWWFALQLPWSTVTDSLAAEKYALCTLPVFKLQ